MARLALGDELTTLDFLINVFPKHQQWIVFVLLSSIIQSLMRQSLVLSIGHVHVRHVIRVTIQTLVSVNVVSEKHLLHVSHAWRLPL
jgi:Tfp pilus assembly pilus retraction ATPase PilT